MERDPMSPILVRVIDPSTGDTLEEKTLDNDFILLCHGRVYLDGQQYYPTTGTSVLTVKKRRVVA